MTDLQKEHIKWPGIYHRSDWFLSGEFIISSAIFAGTAIASNININRKLSRKNRLNQNQVKRQM